jgi:FkbM family methyltransferase
MLNSSDNLMISRGYLFYFFRFLARNTFRFIPYKILKLIEKAVADSQGKGFGSSSINQEIKVVKLLLPRIPLLAIDIGGNIGNYSANLKSLNKNLEIHIFEPSHTNIEKLNARFFDDNLLKIIPLAISDQAGSAILYSDQPGSGLGSLRKRNLSHLNINFNERQNISTIRFEDYWKKQLLSRKIDIIKIDIEGHELAALKGFGSAIFEIFVIQFEFGGCNIDTRTFFKDFWDFFSEKEFDLYRITPFGAQHISFYSESDEFFSTTNYIARNRILDIR